MKKLLPRIYRHLPSSEAPDLSGTILLSSFLNQICYSSSHNVTILKQSDVTHCPQWKVPMGRRAQKWGGGTTQCFRLTGVETEAQKTHMTSPRQLLNVIVPRPRISSNTHHNTFPVLSPLPFHPNNQNIQCSWWAASCCHPSDDHGTSFFLSESNARCYFVP